MADPDPTAVANPVTGSTLTMVGSLLDHKRAVSPETTTLNCDVPPMVQIVLSPCIGATVGAPTNMVSYLRVVPQSFTIESVMITLPLPTGVTIAIGLPLMSCPVVIVAIVGSEL